MREIDVVAGRNRTDPLFNVAGKVVLISGGTRGIGKALAQGFAERFAQVIVTGRREEDAEQAARQIEASLAPNESQPGSCDGFGCNVSHEEEISRLVDNVLHRFGRIDVLLNVAGINRRRPAETLATADFDDVLRTNLRGPFLLSQAVGASMLAARHGCQINIASLNSDRPLKEMVAYAASKSGLAQMTRALALEWGRQGVRVNAIAPGFILTDFNRSIWESPVMRQWGEQNTPLIRLGVPEDILGTALFLAAEASAFMTGQVLYVDGGFTAGTCWPYQEREATS